ncbi:MAG: hypothetical protein ACR652_18605 [Methylocystis sp.]|uniref:hypothetical protein n=1 Tax=Methylocystis sp. TaxID=1911079 RepID=UPI003DA2533A
MSKSTHHFFASNPYGWQTDESVVKLATKMKNDGTGSYNLYYVPLPPEAPYRIDEYRPQVDGIIFLGKYDPKGNRIYPM